jgi:hypothetical protein
MPSLQFGAILVIMPYFTRNCRDLTLSLVFRAAFKDFNLATAMEPVSIFDKDWEKNGTSHLNAGRS